MHRPLGLGLAACEVTTLRRDRKTHKSVLLNIVIMARGRTASMKSTQRSPFAEIFSAAATNSTCWDGSMRRRNCSLSLKVYSTLRHRCTKRWTKNLETLNVGKYKCKFIKTKHYSDSRNIFFLAATLVG